MKYKLSVTRGEMGRDNGRGKGFSGTTVKVTWTKPRQVEAWEGVGFGWSRGKWWVNADSSN